MDSPSPALREVAAENRRSRGNIAYPKYISGLTWVQLALVGLLPHDRTTADGGDAVGAC